MGGELQPNNQGRAMSNEPRDSADPFAPQSLDDYLAKTSAAMRSNSPSQHAEASAEETPTYAELSGTSIDLTDPPEGSVTDEKASAVADPEAEELTETDGSDEFDEAAQAGEPFCDPEDDEELPMNAFAIASVVTAPFTGILGIIFGHIAIKQLNERDERGAPLAVTGIVVGYLVSVLAMLAITGTVTDEEPEIDRTQPSTSELSEPVGPPTTEPNPSEVDPGEVDDEASEIDPDAMGQPWMGTELEKFCETLFDTELEAEDSIAYLRTLADASVDRTQAQQFNDVADYIEGEPTHLSEAGAMDTIEEALFAGYDQCWQ